MAILATYLVNERARAKFTCKMTEEDEETVILPDALSTLKLTLYDLQTRTVINSRQQQNVKNANNGEVDSEGVFTWKVQSADNALVNSNLLQERHRALLEWTWPDGYGNAEFDIVVKNMFYIPGPTE